MKNKQENQELEVASEKELRGKLDEACKERLNLVLNAATAHIKDYSQFKKSRKKVARILTHQRKLEIG
jgi:ribosomal protein L29